MIFKARMSNQIWLYRVYGLTVQQAVIDSLAPMDLSQIFSLKLWLYTTVKTD